MKNELLKEAWELRQKGVYTMREVANKLGVNREQLIKELTIWLEQQSNKPPKPASRKAA